MIRFSVQPKKEKEKMTTVALLNKENNVQIMYKEN